MKKLFTLAILFTFFHSKAQPGGWLYSLPIQVQNTNTVNAIDYQLKITINTQSLITANQMNASGNDIRFSGNCGGAVTFYNYWIESGINTPTTTIWVKIPFIAASGTTTVFMFYGNPTAAAASTIPGTFRGPNSATDSVSGGTSGGLTLCQRGFRFSPNQNVLVTQFGKNEPSGTTRYVTLFDFTTQAILSQTQVAGPAATYTYGSISNPIWLTTGTQYVLEVFGLATDGYYYGPSSQIGQHLTYYDMRYINGGTQNTFPTSVLSGYHYGYPDLLYYITSTLAITPSYTVGTPGSLISVAGPTAPVCSGVSLTLTTNATGTYSWNTGATNSVIVVTASNAANYFVTQNSSIGCVLTLTANTSPTVTVASSSSSVCLGNSVSLSGSGANTYTWSGGISNGISFTPTATNNYTVTGTNACGTASSVVTITVGALPVTAVSSSSVVCAGNTATLTASGATSYTWSPGNVAITSFIVSPLASSIYTVVGKQGNCLGTNTIALSTNPNPTIAVSASSSLACQGDAITLSASGGNTYTWTPGNLSGPTITVSPTTSTSYSVGTTNAFGCSTGSSQVVITVPSPVIVVSANNYAVCPGDPVDLSASGATSYSWSTGAGTASLTVNPTNSTIYTVVGTASNCSSSQSLQINVFTPSISISGPTAVCSGNTATLQASGASSYTWSNGSNFPGTSDTPTSTTVYTLSTISTSLGLNCPNVTTVQVIVNPSPSVSVVVSRSVICKGEAVTFSASGANTYSWSDGSTTPNVSLTPTLITIISYSVTGTNSQGCKATAGRQVVVNGCNGIDMNSLGDKQLIIYPNPNNGNFTISYDSALELRIVNELGQLVKTVQLTESNGYKVSVSGLSKGVYFVTDLRGGNNFKQKVIID